MSFLKTKQTQISIFIAGDSTASNKNANVYPETGWGQIIEQLFNKDVCVKNYAINGRSSKSFIEEGVLDKIADEIRENDYLLIQFGHNDKKYNDPMRYTDPKTTYKEYLTRYIDCARHAKAFPILLTPVNRRDFDDAGRIINTHGDYPEAMRELSVDKDVPLLDITKASKDLFEKLGIEKTKEIFLWLEPGENKNYPDGVKDNTHFSEIGAKRIAELIVEEIKNTASLKDLAKKANRFIR